MGFEQKSWKEFREAGLLWWINRGLHLFGWSIVMDIDEDGDIFDVYPGRVTYRGFREEDEKDGFRQLTDYLAKESKELADEAGTPAGPQPKTQLKPTKW